jgi:phosphatidylserine/phosphatidylglycerophosphate/cardiolipin synthase-like enzyme
MPFFVTTAPNNITGLEIEGANCNRVEFKGKKQITAFSVQGEFIAYASPDSTYAVTKKLFDSAKKEIMIGIYDFSADYIKELLLNAMERGVEVTLMLDAGLQEEKDLLEELAEFGCITVPAPACSNTNKDARYFPNCHEKFVIIDSQWVMVQSGNYSKNSIPFNEEDGGDTEHFKKGNRDMGVAIKSKELATFFKKVLKSDIKLVTDVISPESLKITVKAVPQLVELVPEELPTQLFKSKTFKPKKAIEVMPVLTPDNYLPEVIKLLKSAKKSILIENQYIKSDHEGVSDLLEAIRLAIEENNDLDVRIVLGKIFNYDEVPNEKINLKNIKDKYGLVLKDNIRYINTKQFVHCHNKLIIVDDKVAVISSQNWSRTAVGTNREAGLILYYPEIAKYYASIFESDWESAISTLPKKKKNTIEPESLKSGNYTEVSLGDYEEV